MIGIEFTRIISRNKEYWFLTHLSTRYTWILERGEAYSINNTSQL
jgi:hypothetical protein